MPAPTAAATPPVPPAAVTTSSNSIEVVNPLAGEGNDIFINTSDGWVSLQGPQGIQGPTGATGSTGPPSAVAQTAEPDGDPIFLWVDTDDVPPPASPIPVVTTLPASPADGQEVYYHEGIGVEYLWHLRYNAAWAFDGYGWQFLGGAPLSVEDVSSCQRSSATYGDPTAGTAGPSLWMPLKGIYGLAAGCLPVVPSGQATAVYAVAALKLGAAAATDNERVSQFTSPVATTAAGGMIGSGTIRRTLSALDEVRMQYRNNLGTATYLSRWITATPVRVG